MNSRSPPRSPTNRGASASNGSRASRPGTAALTPATADLQSQKEVAFVSHDSAGFTVKGRMTLPGVPHQMVLGILKDYNDCPRIFGNILECSSETLPSGDVKLSQTCRWGFMGFSGKFDCSYQVHEVQDSPGSLQFNLIQSSFMRNFQGQWNVQPAPAATPTATDGCFVEHTMLIKPSMRIPRPVARLANGIFVSQVSQIFNDLEAEVSRRVAAERISTNASA